MPSPLKLMTTRAFNAFTLKGIIISEREKPGQVYQEEDNLPKGLPKEATVLGTIQILCFLVISSLGVILVSVPNSSQLSPAISTILMSGYPFLGALCFAITGTLSIVSGKKSSKPFATNSLISSAVSSLAAGAGLILLANSLVALRTASQQCDSGRDYLASLPYSRYYYSIYEVKDCLLTSVGLTPRGLQLARPLRSPRSPGVSDAVQPPHALLPPSPPALNLSQQQGLFQRVSSLYQVAKVLELQLQQESFQ